MTEFKKSFVLYTNYFEILKDLSDSDAGILFKAILQFQTLGTTDKLPPHLEMAFKFIKNQFEIDSEKYEKKVEKQRENGKKGGRPKTQKNPKNPMVFLETQKSLNDNDNDNDNDNKEEVEEEKLKNLDNFYGEFKNVYLSSDRYDSLKGLIMNDRVFLELINELSTKIAEKSDKYKPYDEKFPNAHFSYLRNFWKFRQNNPQKFIAKVENIDEYSAALKRGAQMYKEYKEKQNAVK